MDGDYRLVEYELTGGVLPWSVTGAGTVMLISYWSGAGCSSPAAQRLTHLEHDTQDFKQC